MKNLVVDSLGIYWNSHDDLYSLGNQAQLKSKLALKTNHNYIVKPFSAQISLYPVLFDVSLLVVGSGIENWILNFRHTLVILKENLI